MRTHLIQPALPGLPLPPPDTRLSDVQHHLDALNDLFERDGWTRLQPGPMQCALDIIQRCTLAAQKAMSDATLELGLDAAYEDA